MEEEPEEEVKEEEENGTEEELEEEKREAETSIVEIGARRRVEICETREFTPSLFLMPKKLLFLMQAPPTVDEIGGCEADEETDPPPVLPP